MSKYKLEFVRRVIPGGDVEDFVDIVASNGKSIARCKTEAMAAKILKGLKLYETLSSIASSTISTED